MNCNTSNPTPIDPIKELKKCISSKDFQRARMLLEGNPGLGNSLTDENISLLHFACYHKDEEMIELFLIHKTEIDIFEASILGHVRTVQSITENNGMSIHQYSGDGFQPLGLATFFGKIEAAKYLISSGADINAISRNEMKVTPLHSALTIGHLGLLDILLSSGADPNIAQMKDISPLHVAAYRGDLISLLKLIQAGARVDAKDSDGYTPLDYAKKNGHLKLAMVLEKYQTI
jgi:uncharacterized protein